MKWRAIPTILPLNAIVTPPKSGSEDSQDQKTCLVLSTDDLTNNYDTECSNRHSWPSTAVLKGFSTSRKK